VGGLECVKKPDVAHRLELISTITIYHSLDLS